MTETITAAATFLGWEMPDTLDDLPETIIAWRDLIARLEQGRDHRMQAGALTYRTRLRCGLAYCLLEDWPQARQMLEEAEMSSEREPSLSDVATLLLGTVDAAQGCYEQAIARWTEVIDRMVQSKSSRKPTWLWPHATTLYLYRGELYAEMGQYEQAIADCERALCDHPDCAEAYAVRGLCLAYLDRYEQAIADGTRAIELAPGDASVYRRRARTYVKMREYAAALADCDLALALDPKDVQAATTRSEAALGYLFQIMACHAP
jgi:tetratricopeptide (TPR) repeat protein